MKTPVRTLLILAAAFLLSWLPDRAEAQSLTSAGLVGEVASGAGGSVSEALVRLVDRTNGSVWTTTTGRMGRFSFASIQPGEYDLSVEALGYRPLDVLGIAILPAKMTSLALSVTPEPPPVTRRDTTLSAATGGRIRGTGERWVAGNEATTIPAFSRSLAEISWLSSSMDTGMGAEGLPGSLTRIFIDGFRFTPASTSLAEGKLGAVLPRGALGYLNVIPSVNDAEWWNEGGAVIAIGTRRAGNRRRVSASGSGAGVGWANPHVAADADQPMSLFGSAQLDLPLVPDTSAIAVTFEVDRTENPRFSGLSEDARSAVGIGPAWVDEGERIAGTLRGDWLLSANSHLSTIALFGTRKLLPTEGAGIGDDGRVAPSEDTDLLVGGALSLGLSDAATVEVRLGFTRTQRDETTAAGDISTETRFGDSPGLAGRGSDLGTSVTRSAPQLSGALHYVSGVHRLKGGVQFEAPSLDYSGGGSHVFAFADPAQLGLGNGRFIGSEPFPEVSFSTRHVGGFLSHTFAPTASFSLTTGIRADRETIPGGDATLNQQWFDLTDLRTDSLVESLSTVSARVAFQWSPIAGRGTEVFGGASLSHGSMDPALLRTLLTAGDGIVVRERIDGLGGWPTAPAASDRTGTRISLLDQEAAAPRTKRVSFGLREPVSGNTTLHAGMVLRRTENLPRYRELNLVGLETGADQSGRAYFGTLQKQGSLLFASPGTNRRYDDFESVTAVVTDGWSDYLGITVGAEHRAGRSLGLFATYTYSETTDNWIGASRRGVDGRIDPGLPGVSGDDWNSGVSDFDVPHRAVAGATVSADVLEGLELTGLYRFRSGTPFTPGYRPGVDANGDGSGSNDVAPIPTAGELGAVAQDWSCLTTQAGRFPDRNSCRAASVHTVSAALQLGLAQTARGGVFLTIEGVNLFESEYGSTDTALLLVAPSGSIEELSGGDVAVPYIVNPEFGRVATNRNQGRHLRLGIKVTW